MTRKPQPTNPLDPLVVSKWRAINRRRAVLMDREEDGVLTAEEERELAFLQAVADRHVDLTFQPSPVLEAAVEELKRRGLWEED
jgi:hypothetical protein